MLKISAAAAAEAASVLGDLKESHISVWLCRDQRGRKEGSANERASQRDERRTTTAGRWSWRARKEGQEGRERAEWLKK